MSQLGLPFSPCWSFMTLPSVCPSPDAGIWTVCGRRCSALWVAGICSSSGCAAALLTPSCLNVAAGSAFLCPESLPKNCFHRSTWTRSECEFYEHGIPAVLSAPNLFLILTSFHLLCFNAHSWKEARQPFSLACSYLLEITVDLHSRCDRRREQIKLCIPVFVATRFALSDLSLC